MHVERLKAYTPEDAAGIGRLMPYLSKSFDGEPVNEQLLRTIIESDSHEQLVARIDARIIGAATLSIILGAGAGKKGWLEDFVTDPESGVKGTGQVIWDEMGKWCLEHDVNLNFTSRTSREAAHNFYLKNGASVRETTVFQADFK
jgi:hypothetical protein